MSPWQKFKRSSITNQVNAGLSLLIALMTLVNVSFFVKQVLDQDAQTKEVKNVISNGIATAKKTIDASLETQEQELRGILAQNRTAIDSAAAQSKASLDGTLSLGNRSLEVTIEASRLEQRAWVGPTGLIPPGVSDGSRRVYLKAGEQAVIGFQLTNSGRTPALSAIGRLRTQVLRTGEQFVAVYNAVDTITSVAAVLPGAQLLLQLPVPKQGTQIDQATIDELTSGKAILYLYGDYSYEDIFGRKHLTEFCTYLNRSLTSFDNCPTHNSAN